MGDVKHGGDWKGPHVGHANAEEPHACTQWHSVGTRASFQFGSGVVSESAEEAHQPEPDPAGLVSLCFPSTKPVTMMEPAGLQGRVYKGTPSKGHQVYFPPSLLEWGLVVICVQGALSQSKLN